MGETPAAVDEDAVFRKVSWRLIPFLFVLYVAAFLDRVNVGFAALTMKDDLGFGDAVFGFGAGVFFAGYFLFEVPSNLLMARVGARATLCRVLVLWGLVSVAMMGVSDPLTFYALRFLLGAAEAGFFPGVILYLTWWFPPDRRARAVARFMTATALAGVVGGPLSGWLLTWHHLGGLAGWQWLFLVEGVPSVLLGVAVWFVLPDRPADAGWLTPAERAWLADRVRRDEATAAVHSPWAAAADARVWHLAAVYFFLVNGLYGFTIWLPQILKGVEGLGPVGVGFVSTGPYLLAVAGMLLAGASSDRTGERRWHVAGPCLLGAAGLAGAAASPPGWAVGWLCVAAVGIWGGLAPFWSLPPAFLGGSAAAAGIALINSVGNLGGFAGPYLIGRLKEATGGYAAAFAALAGCLAAAAVLAATTRTRFRRR